MAVVAGLSIGGYVVSALLYRKGPSALHARFAALPLVARIGPAASGLLGMERLLLGSAAAFFLRTARVVVVLVLGLLLDVLITRLLATAGATARIVLRIIHNGDVQRSIFLILGALATAVWFWGRT